MSNYGKCIVCKIPLGQRNHTRKVSGLCFNCIRNPPDEYKCTYVYPESHALKKKRGKRCGLHSVKSSKKGYCGVHKKTLEDKE